MKIFQPIVSGSFTTSGSVFLKGLTSAAQSNVVLIDTASGQLYTTASSALVGGETVATASYALTSSYSTNISGSTNYLPKFSGSNSLGNSLIFDNGTNVGIGKTNPTKKLDIAGDILVNDITVGKGKNQASSTTAVGQYALANNTAAGILNSAFGANTLYNNTQGQGNVAIGAASLQANTLGSSNTAIGNGAGINNTQGSYNTFIGGYTLGLNALGSQNTALGYQSLFLNTSGNNNVGLGYFTQTLNNNDSNSIVIGYNATGLGSNTVVIGDINIITTILRGNVGIGTTTPNAKLDVSGSAIISGSLAVTNGITGSLFGTSSWAVSASWAPVQVSGSYALTSSLATNVVGTANRILFNNATNTTTTSNNLTWTDSTNLLTLGDGTGTAGTISKLALYTSSYGGYGLGVSPSQLDYVSDGSHVFYKNGTTPSELVRITNTGEVGIGTTAPGSKLDVNGDIGYLAESAIYPRQKSVASDWYLGKFDGGSRINNSLGSSGDNAFQIGYYGGGTFAPNIKLSAGGGNSSYINSGNVGIGTITPSYKLDVLGNGRFSIELAVGLVTNDNGARILVNGSQTNYNFQIANNWNVGGALEFTPSTLVGGDTFTTPAMVVKANGNVGIGTTAPTLGTLQVNGNVYATSFTGSLFGTASWAENATNVTTATNALSASNFTITSTLRLDGSLTDYATVNSTIVGSNNLYTQNTGSYTSAFVKYTVSNGANARAGEFITVWNGTTVTYFDNSTTDIGSTSDIVFSSAIVTGQVQVNATAASSGWKIKTLATFI
jgi:hypothetical protein